MFIVDEFDFVSYYRYKFVYIKLGLNIWIKEFDEMIRKKIVFSCDRNIVKISWMYNN